MTPSSTRHAINLTSILSRSEFKLRYAGSALGFFWSVAKPLAIFGILYFAFNSIMKFGEGVDRYPLQLLLAIVLWTFFAEATQASTTVLVARADMIRKIAFPRIVLPLSVSGTAALAMAFNLTAVLAICAASGTTPTLRWLLLPLLLVELAVLAIGMGLLLAALFVRYRDIGQIWELGIQLLFYATPIIYPITLVPEHLRAIVQANPIAQIVHDARWIVIDPAGTTASAADGTLLQLVPFAIVACIAAAGWFVFRRAADRVAEYV